MMSQEQNDLITAHRADKTLREAGADVLAAGGAGG
jgi:hypothetical protein